MTIIALVMLFAATACNNENDVSSNSSKEELSEFDEALAYLENGEDDKAYKILYDLKDNEKAQSMLKDFKIFYTKATTTSRGKTNTFEYTYDDHGNLTKEIRKYADGEVDTEEFVYNDKNQRVKAVYTDEYGVKYAEYIYDERGDVVTYFYTDETGYKTETNYSYVYDSNGNLLEKATQNGHTENYTYDENGNVLTKAYDGETAEEYTYDSDGNMTKYVRIYSDGSRYEYEYTYDEKGNKITENYRDTDGLSGVTSFTYDDKNNLTNESCISGGVTYTTSYTYDPYGNLISKIERPDPDRYTYSDYVYIYCPDAD